VAGALTLGTRTFAISAGKRVALGVRLNTRARRLLAARKALRARVVVAWRADGRSRSTSQPVTLRHR
jgi:hypothetical protein